jgi:hypothetical protein
LLGPIFKIVGPGSIAMWSYLFVAGLSALSYVAIFPASLATCAMLISKEIPVRVKIVATAVEFVSFAQVLWFTHGVLGFKHGPFGMP